MTITVEVCGVELFGRHGVEAEEQAVGQTFVWDVEYDVDDAAAGDVLGSTVDYRAIAACLRDVSDGGRFALLEALCAAAADELLSRFELSRVRVRVRKPVLRLAGLRVASAAATVERRRP